LDSSSAESFFFFSKTKLLLGLFKLDGQSHSIQKSGHMFFAVSTPTIKFKSGHGYERIHLNTIKKNFPWPWDESNLSLPRNLTHSACKSWSILCIDISVYFRNMLAKPQSISSVLYTLNLPSTWLDEQEVVPLHSGSPSTIYDVVRAACQETCYSSRQLLWHGSENFTILFTQRVKFSNLHR